MSSVCPVCCLTVDDPGGHPTLDDCCEALVEVSHDLLKACQSARGLLKAMNGHWPGTMSINARKVDGILQAAIAKATGTT